MKNLQFNTYENQFGKYNVPDHPGWLNPGGIAHTLKKGKVWEPKTIEFIQKILIINLLYIAEHTLETWCLL